MKNFFFFELPFQKKVFFPILKAPPEGGKKKKIWGIFLVFNFLWVFFPLWFLTFLKKNKTRKKFPEKKFFVFLKKKLNFPPHPPYPAHQKKPKMFWGNKGKKMFFGPKITKREKRGIFVFGGP